jgi:hypothetical protein
MLDTCLSGAQNALIATKTQREMKMTNAQKSLGRYWGSASNAHLTEFVLGDALIRLTWADGAEVVCGFDTHAEARACLKRLGFSK